MIHVHMYDIHIVYMYSKAFSIPKKTSETLSLSAYTLHTDIDAQQN